MLLESLYGGCKFVRKRGWGYFCGSGMLAWRSAERGRAERGVEPLGAEAALGRGSGCRVLAIAGGMGIGLCPRGIGLFLYGSRSWRSGCFFYWVIGYVLARALAPEAFLE